jgi:hypothetical protein
MKNIAPVLQWQVRPKGFGWDPRRHGLTFPARDRAHAVLEFVKLVLEYVSYVLTPPPEPPQQDSEYNFPVLE